MSRRLLVAGHRGLLGSALLAQIAGTPTWDLATVPHGTDFRDRELTERTVRQAQPDAVLLVAGKVGGLGDNIRHPAEFLEDNLRIQTNVIRAAYEAGATDLVFVASANAYPADAPQPIPESALGTGLLDADTEAYGLAKLTGMRLCEMYRRQYGVRYRSVAPCNLYGSGDRFDPSTAHVVPAMLHRFHEAATTDAGSIAVWGSGNQRRQLLHANDLADACLHVLAQARDFPTHLNVGPHDDVSIAELAHLVADVVGFAGRIDFDTSKPEGVQRRLLDVSALADTGWRPAIELRDGVAMTYDWYLQQVAAAAVETRT